ARLAPRGRVLRRREEIRIRDAAIGPPEQPQPRPTPNDAAVGMVLHNDRGRGRQGAPQQPCAPRENHSVDVHDVGAERGYGAGKRPRRRIAEEIRHPVALDARAPMEPLDDRDFGRAGGDEGFAPSSQREIAVDERGRIGQPFVEDVVNLDDGQGVPASFHLKRRPIAIYCGSHILPASRRRRHIIEGQKMKRTFGRTALAAASLAGVLALLVIGPRIMPDLSGQAPGFLTTANGEWPYYTADVKGSRYSPLDQINASNFNQPEVAWRFTH